MSKELAPHLPRDLVQFLRSDDSVEKFHQIILFSTVDANCWPRYGMLSPYELTAKDALSLYVLILASTKSAENLRRNGKLGLVFLSPKMSYYVCAQAKEIEGVPEAPRAALFEAAVRSVSEDKLATARIVTGLTFEGFDPGMGKRGRRAAFRRLLSLR